MILYFSGTGNSAYIAQRIGVQTGDMVCSVNKYLKGKKLFCDREVEKLVFVVPTYAWRIPRVVEQWILRSSFSKDAKAYFVMSCGDSIGKAAEYVKKLCLQKEFVYMGCAQVVMPENYIAMFSAPEGKEAREIVKRAIPKMDEIIERIAKDIPLEEEAPGFLGGMLSGFANTVFYPAFVHAKKFKADDTCTGCGKCVKVCPLNNIRLEGKKPRWSDCCTHCMACITSCPAEAIEYGKKSVGQPRYRFPNEKGHTNTTRRSEP